MASNGRLAWLVIGAISTVVTLTATSSGVWFLTSFRPPQHDKSYAESYAWNAKTLTVQLSSGDIQVRQGQAGHVGIVRDLRWTRSRPSVSEHWNGHALDVTSDCPADGFGETCSVDYTITLPPRVSITAITDSGSVTAAGVDGSLTLSTLSGDVSVTGARSAAVTASTDSGDIRLGFAAAPDSVRATTAAGDVTVEVPRGGSYAVHPTADSGDTSISVSNDPSAPRAIIATSDAGNVSVAYASDAGEISRGRAVPCGAGRGRPGCSRRAG